MQRNIFVESDVEVFCPKSSIISSYFIKISRIRCFFLTHAASVQSQMSTSSCFFKGKL